MNQTFEMMNIPSGAQFVLIGKKTFEWNPKKKGPNINVSLYLFQISYGNLIANKIKEVTYESILSTLGFSGGSHYWEFTVRFSLMIA